MVGATMFARHSARFSCIFQDFLFYKNLNSVNIRVLCNILDILDIEVWSLKKNLSDRDSIIACISFLRCEKCTSHAIFFKIFIRNAP